VSRRHSHIKPAAVASGDAPNAKRSTDFLPILVGIFGVVVAFVVSMAFVVMQRLAAPLVCPPGTVKSVEVTSSTSVNGRGTFHADLYCVQANGTALRPSFSPTLVVFSGMVVVVALVVVALVIVRRRRR
jgi:flagellar biogenesis protein FliO